MLYIRMDTPCKRPPPFLAREFQAPVCTYSGEYVKFGNAPQEELASVGMRIAVA